MAQIAKILPIPRTVNPSIKSTANSLLAKGFSRQAGSSFKIMPVKLPDGRYLTGLDENAPYVLKMSEQDRLIEQPLILEKRIRLEKATGLDLGPRSVYYSEMLKRDPRDSGVEKMLDLHESGNTFNFEDPFQEIKFTWAALHPSVASSLEAYNRDGNQRIKFYVQNPEEEAGIIYKEKQKINKSVILLESFSIEKRKMIARLIALPIGEDDKEQVVYNLLDSFIKSGTVKEGEYKGYSTVDLFNRIAGMKDKQMVVKDAIRKAIDYNIYHKKYGKIWEGEVPIAEDEDSLVLELASSKGQESYMALDAKLQQRKKITYR